jgi:hypothetical protein
VEVVEFGSRLGLDFKLGEEFVERKGWLGRRSGVVCAEEEGDGRVGGRAR